MLNLVVGRTLEIHTSPWSNLTFLGAGVTHYLWLVFSLDWREVKWHLLSSLRASSSVDLIDTAVTILPAYFLEFHRFPHQMVGRVIEVVLNLEFSCLVGNLTRRFIEVVLFTICTTTWLAGVQLHQCTLSVLFIVQLKHDWSPGRSRYVLLINRSSSANWTPLEIELYQKYQSEYEHKTRCDNQVREKVRKKRVSFITDAQRERCKNWTVSTEIRSTIETVE